MIYTVVLNSRNYFSNGGNNSSITYGIDWSFLPQGKKYKVSFSFNSKRGTFTADNVIQVYADFTGSPTTYEANGTVSQKVSNFLGVLHPELISSGNDSHLQAHSTDNTPIFINDRPSNNTFTIRLLDNTGTAYNPAVDYLMVLSFEEYIAPKGRQYFD